MEGIEMKVEFDSEHITAEEALRIFHMLKRRVNFFFDEQDGKFFTCLEARVWNCPCDGEDKACIRANLYAVYLLNYFESRIEKLNKVSNELAKKEF